MTHLTHFTKRLIQLMAGLSILLGASMNTHAADIDMNANQNDIAISGYDPVAYFTESAAQAGTSQFTATYKNAIYYFSSAQNRDLFKAEPSKYAPQFGGFCAMGVALHKKLDVDPHAWYIEGGKLYLNLNKKVQKKWFTDVAGHIAQANEIWEDVKTIPAAKLNES